MSGDTAAELGSITDKPSKKEIIDFLGEHGFNLKLAPKKDIALTHIPDDHKLQELVGKDRLDLARYSIDLLLKYMTGDTFFDQIASHEQRGDIVNELKNDPQYGEALQEFLDSNQIRINKINDVQAYIDNLERSVDKNPQLDQTVKSPLVNTLYKIKWLIKDATYHPKGEEPVTYDQLKPEEKMTVVGKVIGGINEVFIAMFPDSSIGVFPVTAYTHIDPALLPYERIAMKSV